jgi:hypothetical protein
MRNCQVAHGNWRAESDAIVRNHKELIKDLSGDVAKDFMHHLEEFGQVPVLSGAETAAQHAVMPQEFHVHQPLHTTTDTLKRWKAVAKAVPR